jgi:hypothetical protein
VIQVLDVIDYHWALQALQPRIDERSGSYPWSEFDSEVRPADVASRMAKAEPEVVARLGFSSRDPSMKAIVARVID